MIFLLLLLSADLMAEIPLENPEINVTYTDAFKITNLLYSSGDEITFNLSFGVSSPYNNISQIIEKTVKKFTSAKTSNITFLHNTSYLVCVTLLINDTNNSNNHACKVFALNETNTINQTDANITDANRTDEQPNLPENVEQTCDYLQLMQPTTFVDKAELQYSVNLKEFSAQYWVEDVNGNIAKKEAVTSNDNKKSFTPKFAGGYIFKVKVNDCEKESLFLVRKELDNKLEIKKFGPDIVSFYVSTNEFISEGITLELNEQELFTADLLTGEYKVLLPKTCGTNEITLTAGENTYSELQEIPCEESVIVEESNEYEKLREDFDKLSKEISNIKVTEQKPLTPTASVTGTTENNSNALAWICLLLFSLYAFADKFKKLNKSIKNHEQKRNQRKS